MANELNRLAVSSWMPFKYDADGSLDLERQGELPSRPQGRLQLTMRLYAPKGEALTRKMESSAGEGAIRRQPRQPATAGALLADRLPSSRGELLT